METICFLKFEILYGLRRLAHGEAWPEVVNGGAMDEKKHVLL